MLDNRETIDPLLFYGVAAVGSVVAIGQIA
jgi:hypothetical protein